MNRRVRVVPASRSQTRSPFLDGFEARVAAVTDPPTSTGVPQLAALRAQLHPPEVTDPLLAALRAWRTARARAARTEPATVVPDEVLVEIAARRPRTRPEIDAVAGLGPARRNRFADELLAVVARAEHVR